MSAGRATSTGTPRPGTTWPARSCGGLVLAATTLSATSASYPPPRPARCAPERASTAPHAMSLLRSSGAIRPASWASCSTSSAPTRLARRPMLLLRRRDRAHARDVRASWSPTREPYCIKMLASPVGTSSPAGVTPGPRVGEAAFARARGRRSSAAFPTAQRTCSRYSGLVALLIGPPDGRGAATGLVCSHILTRLGPSLLTLCQQCGIITP